MYRQWSYGRIFGTLKTEMFYGKKFKTLEELMEKIVEYIKFYNEERFQKKIRMHGSFRI